MSEACCGPGRRSAPAPGTGLWAPGGAGHVPGWRPRRCPRCCRVKVSEQSFGASSPRYAHHTGHPFALYDSGVFSVHWCDHHLAPQHGHYPRKKPRTGSRNSLKPPESLVTAIYSLPLRLCLSRALPVTEPHRAWSPADWFLSSCITFSGLSHAHQVPALGSFLFQATLHAVAVTVSLHSAADGHLSCLHFGGGYE